MSNAEDIFKFRREGLSVPDHSKGLGSASRRIEVDGSFFVDLGCATWKLHERMFDRGTGEPKDEFRQVARHVATIRDRLSEIGLRIQDHTGDAYDSGQSLEVLAFQPTEGIRGEIVIETVRPSLYLHEQRIFKGQVIVGTPLVTEEGKK